MNYKILKIPSKIGKEFIKEYHYSHGCHNGPMCYGLFDDKLIGVIAFATPCSENVRSSVFGEKYKNTITELHRLVILDEYGRNTESYFIANSLKQLHTNRPDLYAVISFADSTENHVGTIYQATNALYTGMTPKSIFYKDENGVLRHPRQNGVNITKTRAKELNWIPVERKGKYRYLFLLPKSKPHKTWMLNHLQLTILPYPKIYENFNNQ